MFLCFRVFRVFPWPKKFMLKAEQLTYKIRGAIFEVSRQLGAGFLEKVYENAQLIVEF